MSQVLETPRHITDSSFVDEKGVMMPATKQWLRQIPTNLGGKITTLYSQTKAKRLKTLASDFADGTQWKETDTGLTYVSIGENWVPLSGRMTTDQDHLPTGLGAGDAGLEVFVSDYNHVLRWSGAGWEFLPGDHSGYTQTFLIDPGIGWQACDGTVGVLTLLSDGSLDASVTVPTTANLWYRQ